jgi:hypothetical protein
MDLGGPRSRAKHGPLSMAPSAVRTFEPGARPRERRENGFFLTSSACATTCWISRRQVVSALRCCAPQSREGCTCERGKKRTLKNTR